MRRHRSRTVPASQKPLSDVSLNEEIEFVLSSEDRAGEEIERIQSELYKIQSHAQREVESHNIYMTHYNTPVKKARKTPWFPNGAPFPTNVSEEILAFSRLMSLDAQEREQRNTVILSMAHSALKIWPKCTLHIDLSYATGTCDAAAPLILKISGCGTIGENDISALEVTGHVSQCKFELNKNNEKECIFEYISSNGIRVQSIISEAIDKQTEKRKKIVENFLDMYPQARPLSILIYHILNSSSSSLVGFEAGALSQDALLILCLFACKKYSKINNNKRIDDMGELLNFFLKEIGCDFDMKQNAIYLSSNEEEKEEEKEKEKEKNYYIDKIHTKDQIDILAPEEKNINMAAKFTSFRMVRATLNSFSIALKNFDHRTTLTPLSSIVSHRPLWRRVNGRVWSAPVVVSASDNANNNNNNNNNNVYQNSQHAHPPQQPQQQSHPSNHYYHHHPQNYNIYNNNNNNNYYYYGYNYNYNENYNYNVVDGTGSILGSQISPSNHYYNVVQGYYNDGNHNNNSNSGFVGSQYNDYSKTNNNGLSFSVVGSQSQTLTQEHEDSSATYTEMTGGGIDCKKTVSSPVIDHTETHSSCSSFCEEVPISPRVGRMGRERSLYGRSKSVDCL